MSIKIKLLVIDDAKLMRFSVRTGLRTFLPNIEIIEAVNGRHAQQILAVDPIIDIILCDLDMPELNGRDFVIWIRQEEHLRNIPIIVVTGNHDRKDVIDLVHLGIDGYVVKPFNMEKLALRIKEVLDKYGIHFEAPSHNNDPLIHESVAILTGMKNKDHDARDSHHQME